MAAKIARIALAVLMIVAGTLHFVWPAVYAKAVPHYLPDPALLVAVSGFLEIAGGLGLLIPYTCQIAAYGLIVLFIAIFPANLNMALHPQLFPQFPAWAFWARLPFQLVFIAWAWMSRPKRT
jgi:uncharacterized membrane protein